MFLQNINFDSNGYLQPAQKNNLDIELFEQYFVDQFPNSIRRRKLFENYLNYTTRFQKEIFPHFEQWIDGSFISKKENPHDIDMVTFLDYKVAELRGDKTTSQFLSFSLEDLFIDAYIVRVYPTDHPKFEDYQKQKNLWVDRFNSDMNKIPKGFISIKFSK